MRRLLVLFIAGLGLTTPAYSWLTLTDTIRLNDPRNGYEPWGVACGPAGDLRVYVTCLYGPSHLMVLDAEADTVVARGSLTGPYPHGIEINAGGDRAYVASSGGTVSIVDTRTLAELRVTELGGVLMDLCLYEPAAAIGKVYVVDMNGARVRVLDGASGDWMRDVPVGNYPYDVCAVTATNRIYVANLSDGTVSVIDALTDQVVATVPVGAYPEGIAADPALNLVYAANRDDNTVSVIDGHTHRVIATYPVGQGPVKVAVDPTTHRVYVVNFTSQDVSVLTPEGPTGLTVSVGLLPRGAICVDSSLGRVFVTNLQSDDLTAFRTAPPWCVSTVRLRFDPADVALAPPLPGGSADEYSLLVANNRGHDAYHLDLTPGSLARRYEPGYVPTDVDARLSDGRMAAVVANADALVLIDGATGAATDTITVGDEPGGLCLCEETDRGYVANWASQDLSVVDLDSAKVIDTVPLTQGALDVAVDEGLHKVFVTTWWGLLWIIDDTTHEILDSISLSGYCEVNQLAVDPLRHLVYVVGLNCPILWVVDGRTHEVGPPLILPDYGSGIAVNEYAGRVYVTAGSLLLAIGPDFAVEEMLPLPGTVARCAADPGTQHVLVSGSDENGGVVFVVLDGEPEGVGDRPRDHVMPGPARLRVSAPMPNPTGSTVWLRVDAAPAGEIRTEVFDVTGALLRTLSTRHASASAAVMWDGRLADGSRVPAGAYLLRVRAGDQLAARRAIIMR